MLSPITRPLHTCKFHQIGPKPQHVCNICIVRSLQRENNYFKIKIGHPLKVKVTSHKGKKIVCCFWYSIFLCDSMSIFACPSKKIFFNCILCSQLIFKDSFSHPTSPPETEDFLHFFLPKVHLSPAQIL